METDRIIKRVIGVDRSMVYAPSATPSVPATASVSSKARADFQQVKGQLSTLLDSMASWELAPSGFEKVRMKFTESGNDAQAKAFLAAISK